MTMVLRVIIRNRLSENLRHRFLLNEPVDVILMFGQIMQRNSFTLMCSSLRAHHCPDDVNNPVKEVCPQDTDSRDGFIFARDIPDRSTQSYRVQFRSLILEKKLGDALAIHDKIVSKDKRLIDRSAYNILIWGCGKYGYSRKAYELYTKMKESQLAPSNVTYTSLFNSFANSPYKSESLKLCEKVLRDVKKFDINLNYINYHAMIKAYGRCGDILMAFDLVDEMMSKKIPVNSETISFLLQGCLSQTESGFILAIMIWGKMKQYRIPRIIQHYNLLLRITKSCGVKEAASLHVFLMKNPTFFLPISLLDTESNASENTSKLLPITKKSRDDSAFSNYDSPEKRYNGLGGLDGLLAMMKKDKVKPDIKFFTNILELVPDCDTSENEILNAMSINKVQPDDVFLCMLMKKRCSYNNYEGAKEVLKLFNEYNVKLNVLVYGILATTCRTANDAKMYLESLDSNEIRLNVQILGCMLNNACRSLDYQYIIYLMKQYKIHKITPSKQCLKSLANAHKRGRQIELDIDNNVDVPKKLRQRIKRISYKHFVMSYRPWIKLVRNSEADPWEQFTVKYEDD